MKTNHVFKLRNYKSTYTILFKIYVKEYFNTNFVKNRFSNRNLSINTIISIAQLNKLQNKKKTKI